MNSALPPKWWETCVCVSRVFSKRDRIPLRETIARLDEYQAQGIGCIEIFAPYHGGDQYGALDPYNFYIVDPDIGVMADFLKLIDDCHKRRMAVIIFINVGYAAMNNADFLKAQDDVRRGIDSRETRMFVWNDTGETPFGRSLSTDFGKKVEGHWVFSERAGKYYWVKWCGFKNDVALPQYNFGSHEWRGECKKILKFWMDTGIDGVIIDAPFCYTNCDFETHNQCITDIIGQYPNQYIQPEGGGAAGESLETWLQVAKYNSLQDYSLCTGWDKRTVIADAIESGDPSAIETHLQGWRDRVNAAGGTTYLGLIWSRPLTPDQRLLELITIVTTGAMLHDDNKLMYGEYPQEFKAALSRVLRICSSQPALRLNGQREVLLNHDGCYVFRRYDAAGSEALVALNYANAPRSLLMPIPKWQRLQDALSGEEIDTSGVLSIQLDPYGFRIFLPKQVRQEPMMK